MRAIDDASEGDDDELEDDRKLSANKQSHISGDDLGDSFTVDDKSLNKKGWVDEILGRKDSEDTEDEESDDLDDSEDDEGSDEEDNDEKAETLKDWEQSDDDADEDIVDGDESEEEEGAEDIKTHDSTEDKKNEMLVTSDRKRRKTSQSLGESMLQRSSSKQELPFKINAPGTIEELCELFQERSNEDIIEAIRRIRICNAIALAAENRKKMQV